jgi:hypothetical protein
LNGMVYVDYRRLGRKSKLVRGYPKFTSPAVVFFVFVRSRQRMAGRGMSAETLNQRVHVRYGTPVPGTSVRYYDVPYVQYGMRSKGVRVFNKSEISTSQEVLLPPLCFLVSAKSIN